MAPFSKQPQTSLFFTPFSAALLAFSFLLSSSLVLASTDTSDVEALEVLYISLNNPPQLTGWNANGRDPCGESWMGITCQGSSVIAIQVSGLGLSGTMGYLLGNLNSLRILDLSNNNIHDSISYSLPASLTILNLANNNLSGSLPYSITTLVSLTYLNLSHNSLSQLIGDVFANLHQLLALDLSFNNLSGDLPNSFGSLSSLTNLYLQNNQLTGSVGVLSDLPLTELNIAFNLFNGWIPQKFSSNPNFIYNGNSFDPPPPPFTPLSPGGSYDNTNHPGPNTNINQGSDSQGDKGMTTGHIVGVVLSSVMVLVCAVFAFVFCFRKLASKGKYEARPSLGTLPLCPDKVIGSATLDQRVINVHMATELKPPPAENLTSDRVQGKTGSSKRLKGPITATSYTVASLQAATKSFSQENLVGEGSLGRVYIAEYPDGKILAVKKIDSAALSLQEEDNFLEAVSNMSRLRHRNIVTLIGLCAEHGQRLLIYEYIQGGTLHDALHFIEDSSRTLTWNARVRVALGTARALEYLHEVCLPSVVHRNFKSANILLDEGLNPHLSDCGLAALTPNTERQVSTQMVGSFGYSAPEFAMSGIYTVKSDVYSFGVVMLELLTGRKPLDSSRTRSEHSLVRWATPQLHDIDALAKMVDPTLNGMYSVKSLSRFADIIALCIQPEPEFRPPMSDVVQALVRLMQRASGVRRSRDESGIPYRFSDHEV